MGTFVIARLTFAEASRRKILLAALVLGVVFLAVYGTGFHFITLEAGRSNQSQQIIRINEISNFIMLAGLYVVNFLTIMMTVLTSVDTISGEINSGTIHTLMSKPIHRWEIVLGKWLGFAGMLSMYLLLMAGGVILLVYLIGGYIPPHPERALLLMELNALLLLSVSLMGGTIFSTLANGVLVFGLFGLAFIGGWMEQIGALIKGSAGQTAQNIGIITSLVLPSEALWRRAAFEVQSPLISAFGVSPFTTGAMPSILMVVYAGIYLLVMFALAVRLFTRRDL